MPVTMCGGDHAVTMCGGDYAVTMCGVTMLLCDPCVVVTML